MKFPSSGRFESSIYPSYYHGKDLVYKSEITRTGETYPLLSITSTKLDCLVGATRHCMTYLEEQEDKGKGDDGSAQLPLL